MKKKQYGFLLSGGIAGLVNGLFGAGGGMILIPLLSISAQPEESTLFPISVSIMLPLCLVSIVAETVSTGTQPLQEAFPYLLGSVSGGILAGLYGKKIPTIWLHRILAGLILWGGIRYLCH